MMYFVGCEFKPSLEQQKQYEELVKSWRAQRRAPFYFYGLDYHSSEGKAKID